MGDRAAQLRSACELLESAEVRVLRRSSLYETAPQGLLDQPWYLNQVIEVETTLLPRQLLKRLLNIEHDMGRRRTVRNGPRTIDLDIVLYGSSLIHTKELTVPHPRMSERRFVLEPLAELAAELRHPESKATMRELLAKVQDQAVRRAVL
jgi:2-amino-4-hydroxy-6-hydroxymethyldihydropteridine diphosphokinase